MSKYRNKKVVIDGNKFDSIKEGNRYLVLKDKLKKGEIEDLELQYVYVLSPPVVLYGRKRKAMTYRCDFRYKENGKRVVEDVKGMLTAVYKLKRHLMMAVYGIEIKES